MKKKAKTKLRNERRKKAYTKRQKSIVDVHNS